MKLKSLCVLLVPVAALGTLCLWARFGDPAAGQGSASVQEAGTRSSIGTPPLSSDAPASSAEQVELHAAVEQGILSGGFRGNGRDQLVAQVTNRGAGILRVKVEAGQMFEAGRNAMVVVRLTSTDVGPGRTVELPLQTVALRTSNRLAEMPYRISYKRAARLEPLLEYAQSRLDLSIGAIQTATLALMENLPVSALAKFQPASGRLKSRFNTDAYRVDIFDLITALSALRDMGVPDSAIALTIDPQVRIEAMIEPLCRPVAIRYYGLTVDTEWAFWKRELLHGEPATRHYALYGIARFYPDVALEMLPRWAREAKTIGAYRLSAIQALADTQRPEAVPILNQLAEELGPDTELARAALGAALYLEQRLDQRAASRNSVAFRAAPSLSGF